MGNANSRRFLKMKKNYLNYFFYKGKLDVGMYSEFLHLWSVLSEAYGMELNVTFPLPAVHYPHIGAVHNISNMFRQVKLVCKVHKRKDWGLLLAS